MKTLDRERIKKLLGLLATTRPEPVQQAQQIIAMQRDVVLPAKAGVCLVVLGYLVFSGWLLEEQSTSSVVLETLKHFFEVYLFCTLLGSICFIAWRRFPSEVFLWLAFTLGLLDGLFMAGLVIVTGGFNSIAFWVFPPLIILNALSIPLAMPQIVLNLLLSFLYMGAVVMTPGLNLDETVIVAGTAGHAVTSPRTNLTARAALMNGAANSNQVTDLQSSNAALQAAQAAFRMAKRMNQQKDIDTGEPPEDIAPGQLLIRASMLWLLMLCCYGAQVLSDRQRRAIQEASEFAAREGQLHSAGRLAAEFAHQIKNPLAIINNAAYSLQRSLREGKGTAVQQIEIIQEEVARADKVITQIMGYAQLSEGRVERLKLAEEIEKAVEQVLPEAVPTGVKLTKRLEGSLPPLLMQRSHLMDILVNLLLNAREAIPKEGRILLVASCNRNQAVEIVVSDNGPGIARDKIGRVFDAYFTTKEKGTGLGLAIVKHNAELYGGTVHVESVLGQGAKFTVTLPARSQPKPFVQ